MKNSKVDLSNYSLIRFYDNSDNDIYLFSILLNNKHKLEDFEKAIETIKDEHIEEIMESGDDWGIISSYLDDFDFIEITDVGVINNI